MAVSELGERFVENPEERILVLDSEEVWRNIISNAFRREEHHPTMCRYPNEAIDEIQSGGISGVITDGSDGWTEIIETAEFHRIPLVLLTADDEQVETAKELGVPYFLKDFKKAKPSLFRGLLKVVNPNSQFDDGTYDAPNG